MLENLYKYFLKIYLKTDEKYAFFKFTTAKLLKNNA